MELPISQLLRKKGLRLTKPRQDVFTTLKESDYPLSVVEIIKLCPHIDAVSIYRTIDLFTKLAITTSVSQGWKQRYELADPFQPHHHHMQCKQCNAITTINSPVLEKIITQLGKEHDFTVTSHSFELLGTCNECRQPTMRPD